MAYSNTTDILKAAQDTYLKGDYDQSIGLMLKNKDSLDQGLFHYNLGSMYLKKNELGPARLHFEKAKKEDFSYPMLWNNLEYVKHQPGVIDPAQSNHWQEYFMANVMDIPGSFFGIYFLIGLSLLLLLLRKRVVRNRLLVVCYSLLLVVPIALRFSYGQSHKFAVALKEIRVYEGPSSIYSDYGQIAAGSRFVVGKFYDNWYYIVSPSDRAGWVKKDELGFY